MSSGGSREALLRTTADVLDHAVVQAEACAEEWPEVQSAVAAIARGAEAIAGRARDAGYVPTVRR